MKLIKRQIRFTMWDIKENIPYFIIGLTQVVVAALILCYVVQLVMLAGISLEKVESLPQTEQVYGIRESGSEQQFETLINENEGLKELQNLYKQLESADQIQRITLNGSRDIGIEKSALPNDKMIDLAKGQYEGVIHIETIRVSKNFFSMFRVTGDYGKEQLSSFFSTDKGTKIIPVFLGNAFQEFYGKGDKIQDTEGNQYIVSGFLSPKSYYISPFEGKNAVNLDNFFVVPAYVDQKDSISLISTIQGSYYTDSSKGTTLNAIFERANQSSILSMEVKSLQSQIQYCIKDIKNEILTMAALAILIFVFASVGLICYLGRYISDYMQEFAINMICGAGKKDVMVRVIMQLGFMAAIAIIVTAVVFGFSAETFATSILVILYGAGMMAWPAIRLKRSSIINIIRSNAK